VSSIETLVVPRIARPQAAVCAGDTTTIAVWMHELVSLQSENCLSPDAFPIEKFQYYALSNYWLSDEYLHHWNFRYAGRDPTDFADDAASLKRNPLREFPRIPELFCRN
jgi:hypothetical protein